VWAGRFVPVAARETDPEHRWFIPYDVWPRSEPLPWSFANGPLYFLSYPLAVWLGAQRTDQRVVRSAVEDVSIAMSLDWDPEMNRSTQRVDMPHLYRIGDLITGPPLQSAKASVVSMCEDVRLNATGSTVAVHYESKFVLNSAQCLRGQVACLSAQYGVPALLRRLLEAFESDN